MAVIKRFIPLEGVKKGDLLLTYDGKEEVVESIEFIPNTEDVYNLEVSGNHNYYAEGILVHNKLGHYKGKDKETEAEIASDQESWTATLESINLISDRAKSLVAQQDPLQEISGEIQEISGETFEKSLAAQVSDFISQQDTARTQAGQAGLVSGTATQKIASGQESFARNLEAQSQAAETETLSFEKGELEEEAGLESTLLGFAQNQIDLYAAYVNNMQSGGDVPLFTGSYTGGEEWTDPTMGAEHLGKMGLGCFPADIKVDGKEISKIEIGDMVSSYNEDTEIVEKAEVIKTFRHKHDDGYLVINGRIRATANHPFYIRRNV